MRKVRRLEGRAWGSLRRGGRGGAPCWRQPQRGLGFGGVRRTASTGKRRGGVPTPRKGLLGALEHWAPPFAGERARQTAPVVPLVTMAPAGLSQPLISSVPVGRENTAHAKAPVTAAAGTRPRHARRDLPLREHGSQRTPGNARAPPPERLSRSLRGPPSPRPFRPRASWAAALPG